MKFEDQNFLFLANYRFVVVVVVYTAVKVLLDLNIYPLTEGVNQVHRAQVSGTT